MKFLISITLVFVVLNFLPRTLDAKVKNPAGVASKGKSLRLGFLDTFPDYSYKTWKIEDLENHYRHSGIKPKKGTVHSFKSLVPERGKVFLRFSLEVIEFTSDEKAINALSTLYPVMKKDFGYIYARNSVVRSGSKIYWLRLSCLYSKKNSAKMHKKLVNSLANISGRHIRCGCGTGCRFVLED